MTDRAARTARRTGNREEQNMAYDRHDRIDQTEYHEATWELQVREWEGQYRVQPELVALAKPLLHPSHPGNGEMERLLRGVGSYNRIHDTDTMRPTAEQVAAVKQLLRKHGAQIDAQAILAATPSDQDLLSGWDIAGTYGGGAQDRPQDQPGSGSVSREQAF